LNNENVSDTPHLITEAKRHLELAAIYENAGDLDRALNECALAIQIAPHWAAAYNSQGLLLDQRGSLEQAILSYQQAVQLDAQFQDAQDNLREAQAELAKSSSRLTLSQSTDEETADASRAVYTSESIELQANILPTSVFTLPPVASFWRRLVAWGVDTLLLGIAGQVLGWTLSSVLFQIGPYGRLVGLCFILSYFGLMNSCVGNGQTVGKRLLRIAVRDSENKPIPVSRSLLRISILAIPATLNQWTLPIFQIPILQWLLTVVIFGFGAAILYTMVFNRRARQGLHDLVCGTYVVHLTGKPIETFPQTAKIHWVISGVLLVLAVVLATVGSFIGSSIIMGTALAPVYKLYQILQTDSRFFTVSVNDDTHYSSQGPALHSLQVQVWYKGVPSDNERTKVMNDIATTVLDNADNINQYDLLRISITSAYDLGIATGHLTYGDGESIETWRERVSSSDTQ
jgi:uncharacterized RDD family membrane protein YckC